VAYTLKGGGGGDDKDKDKVSLLSSNNRRGALNVGY
jgi:hypothetical protein